MLAAGTQRACRFAQIDSSSNYIAVITPGGALHVVDASSGVLHSSLTATNASGSNVSEFQCACWLEANSTAKPQRNAAIAAGSTGGDVVAWNIASNEPIWITEGALSGSAEAISEVSAHECLVVVGAEGTAVSLSSATGALQARKHFDDEALWCCTAVPRTSSVLVGGTRMHLLDAVSLTPTLMMCGHSNRLQAMSCTQDGAYAASGAVRDPIVSIYSLSKPDTATVRTRKATGHVLLSHPPVHLSCYEDAAGASSGQRHFLLLAVTEGGTLEVWKCVKCGKRVEGTQVCCVSVEQGSAGSQLGIMAARMIDANNMQIVKGSAAQPQAEKVAIPKGTGTSVTLRIPSVQPLAGPGAVAPRVQSHQAANVLSTDNHGHALVPRQLVAGSKRAAPSDAAAVSDGEFERVEPLDDEIPLVERLRRLTDAPPDEASKAGDLDLASSLTTESAGPVTADSLVALLTQALRADDKALLEKVFSSGQPAVISNTVARLAPRDAALLFGEAVDRLHSRPARAAALLPWLRALLLSHSSYLAVSSGSKAHVSKLQQLVAARVSLLEPMLTLRGRIEYVLAHAALHRPSVTSSAELPEVAMVDAGRLKHHSMDDFWTGNISDSTAEDEVVAEQPYKTIMNGIDSSDDNISDDNIDERMDSDSDSSDE